MSVENYTNNASTTLNGGINNSTTSIVVTSATGFPTGGNFRIIIDSEIMIVTAVSGTTFTVTRGAESTTGASHADLATVTHVLTAGAIDTIRSDHIQVGAYGSRPSASKAGNIWISNDGPYISQDSGSAWTDFGPIQKLVPVVTGNYSWDNQVSATETVYGGAVVVETESGRASPSVVSRIKTAPSTPYTVTMCFRHNFKVNSSGGTVNTFVGLILKENSTDKRMNFGLFQTDSQYRLVSFSQTGATGGFSTVSNLVAAISSPVWFQISNDGTNLIWRHSHDGYVWEQVSTEAKTAHFTTAPDRVGYCLNQELAKMTIYSWLET